MSSRWWRNRKPHIISKILVLLLLKAFKIPLGTYVEGITLLREGYWAAQLSTLQPFRLNKRCEFRSKKRIYKYVICSTYWPMFSIHKLNSLTYWRKVLEIICSSIRTRCAHKQWEPFNSTPCNNVSKSLIFHTKDRQRDIHTHLSLRGAYGLTSLSEKMQIYCRYQSKDSTFSPFIWGPWLLVRLGSETESSPQ